MEFKNETKENIKYRTGSYEKGFDWYTIRPGEIQVIPEELARNLPLTEIKENVIEKKEEPKEVKEDFRKRESEDTEAYFKELVAIKGVGKKSAKEIIKKYPTRLLLIRAVQDNEEIHKHDGIDKSVKELFEA